MEDAANNLPSTMTISGNSKEETVVKIRSPGKKVLKSIAGSVTLIGALLVFLHLRYDTIIMREIRGYIIVTSSFVILS